MGADTPPALAAPPDAACHARHLHPPRRRSRRPGRLGRARRLPRHRRRLQAQVLRLLDAAVPQRQAAHGACAQLHHQRHDGASVAHEGLQRPHAHGVGRLWAAGGKRRHQKRRAAGALDLRQHRLHEAADAGDGPGDRLEPRSRHLRARVLQVEPVAVFEDAGGGHRLPQDPSGQLGSGGPDRAGQRAGHRRPWLAHGRARRKA
jgi:hypothetical protein